MLSKKTETRMDQVKDLSGEWNCCARAEIIQCISQIWTYFLLKTRYAKKQLWIHKGGKKIKDLFDNYKDYV